MICTLDGNIRARLVFLPFVMGTLRFKSLVARLAALAAALFWAVAPVTTRLFYLHSGAWTEAAVVRHLWPLHLIQPEWIGSPPEYDYLLWMQAETLARLSVVFVVWIASVGWAVRSSRPGEPVVSPNNCAVPNLGHFTE